MTKFLKLLSLGAACAIAVSATPASAQSVQASASVTINKPLTLTKKSDMAFGDIIIVGAGFSTTVSVDATGTRTCDATVITCSGPAKQAVYNVSGNRSRVVNLTIPATVTLSNGTNQLAVKLTGPSTVTLTNSGHPGTDFNIAGEMTISDVTPDGAYTGTFNVTANY